MKILNVFTESMGIPKECTLREVVRFVTNNNLKVENLTYGQIPENLRKSAEVFLEFNDNNEDEESKWEKFLSFELDMLLQKECEHKSVVIGNSIGSQIAHGLNEVDLVIYCSDCGETLFKISENGREIVNLSKH